MKEKIKRILELVRSGKLTLDDAAPLLSALSGKLTLGDSDRELIGSLLARGDLDTAQVAEHLMLLRGVRDAPAAPPPPRAPGWPGAEAGDWSARLSERLDRAQERLNAARGQPERRGGFERMVETIADSVERTVEQAVGSVTGHLGGSVGTGPGGAGQTGARSGQRILKIQVESSTGDEYSANIPVSLAAHLERLIPPHGIRALEQAGFSLQTLQLLIEADPPPGDLIRAEDSVGNEVHISIR